MGRVKNAFHDEIIWNAMDADERQDALYYAQGIEAGTDETGTGSVHESPVAKRCAQPPSPSKDIS